MKKAVILFSIGLVLLVGLAVLASSVLAAKPSLVQASVVPSKNNIYVVIPENVVEVAPGVFSLGTAIDSDGSVVEGYAIVHYKNRNAKPPWAGGGGGSTCYGFLASGAKWKNVEPYIVDAANTEGLNESFVKSNIASDINTWEDAADGVVDSAVTKNILGDENLSGLVDGADTSSPDGKNEVYFGSISESGAIAVTIVWGYFSGPPSTRRLVEWDQVYDQVDFEWTENALLEPSKMDFWNIAIHELGHSFGMNDLYNSECSEETMYGYGTEGETKKRDLNSGDIVGIKKLYA
ncbi:matrixin family metalloprotease [Candidatus Pacearchaeota archaeon]|nr:matrixin family metalloprotease [Candidatus Pacearchaeota archaeon]